MGHEMAVAEYKKFRQEKPLSLGKLEPGFRVLAKGFGEGDVALISGHSNITLHLPVLNWEEKSSNEGVVFDKETLGSQSVIREFFRRFTPDCLPRKSIAASYYNFYDLAEEEGVPFIVVAGGCTYYYWGVHPLYDIDVVVPAISHLERLSEKSGNSVCYNSVSDIGNMNYLNLEDVDVLSDLTLYSNWNGKRNERNFSFEELFKDSLSVDFFGIKTRMTSPEATVLMKFYLGRFGIDKWGIPKDDYEDGWGTFMSQGIDRDCLSLKARDMGITEELELAEKIAEQSLGIKLG